MIVNDEKADLTVPSADNQEAIKRQLDRILAHHSFKNSRRYQAFLRYVIEEKLLGNAAQLKERTIGIAVFHQPLDYDTNANSVVRVTAGEVRRRLAQYYLEATPDNEILIDLPVGSYVPEFRIYEAPLTPEIVPAEAQNSDLIDTDHELDQVQLVGPVTPVPLVEVQTPHYGGIQRISLLLASCFLLVLAVTLAVLHWRSTADNESDRIWQGAFNGQSVLVCAGSWGIFPYDGANIAPATHKSFSFTTARIVTTISNALGHAGSNASLLPEQDTKLDDLHRSPVVLIGAFNNSWTLQLQSPLRYQFVRTSDNVNGIIDTKDPRKKFTGPTGNSPVDYGIFAHFKSPTTGRSTVIATGIGTHGTSAVRVFLTSPELLKDFSKTAPRGWEKGNYEIVFASDFSNDLADAPKVVDAYFWQ